MLEAGKKLQERYRIERQVGQGGMGSVYLATDERFHSTVAIKEALFVDENYRKAFAREARLLNSLKHSALPKVTDHFVDDNGQYIVMEYIGGDDLFEMMRKSGRAFPVSDVMEWADQLIDALVYLHDQGIIHRDIKPQNLKLTPQNKIILLDFGLAKGNPTDANYQTAAKSIFGYSRNYASLEQIQGTGTDPRSDVYSLAATLYHLLTDRVPADALTRVMMVLNENRDPLESAGTFNSAISQEVSDALDKCLSLKATDRPQNAGEMKNALFPGSATSFSAVQRTAGAVQNDELLTMNTKLIDRGADTGGKSRQSEMKTEVFDSGDGNDSVETQVLDQGTERYSGGARTAGGRFGGSLGLASAAGLIALVVGGVAAMVYFWPAGSNAIPATMSDQMIESNGNTLDSNLETDGRPTEALADNGAEETPSEMALESDERGSPKTNSTTDKSVKAAAAPPSKTKPSKTSSGGKVDIKLDGVKITDGKVDTGEVIVTDKGVIFKNTPNRRQPPPPKDLPMSREKYESLTPRQKKLVRDAIERERRLRNLPKPPPVEKPPPS